MEKNKRYPLSTLSSYFISQERTKEYLFGWQCLFVTNDGRL